VTVDLMPGEEMLWEGHPSWRAVLSLLVKGILVSVALIVAFVVAGNVFDSGAIKGWGVLVGVVGMALTVLAGWLSRVFTTYTITDRRLNVRKGVIAKTETSTSLERIQNITILQGAIDRVFRTGTIDFDTASQDASDRFRFFGIDRPQQVREQIARAQEARLRVERGTGL
jgi:uncharacterized membrane protein YdbT with pleckstrin-like domain